MKFIVYNHIKFHISVILPFKEYVLPSENGTFINNKDNVSFWLRVSLASEPCPGAHQRWWGWGCQISKTAMDSSVVSCRGQSWFSKWPLQLFWHKQPPTGSTANLLNECCPLGPLWFAACLFERPDWPGNCLLMNYAWHRGQLLVFRHGIKWDEGLSWCHWTGIPDQQEITICRYNIATNT